MYKGDKILFKKQLNICTDGLQLQIALVRFVPVDSLEEDSFFTITASVLGNVTCDWSLYCFPTKGRGSHSSLEDYILSLWKLGKHIIHYNS